MKKLFGLSLLIFSFNAHASLIDSGSYVTDPFSGWDWLKLENTYFKTYNDVITSTAVGGELEGWLYATSNQWENLLFNQGLTPTQTCTDGFNFCGRVDGVSNFEGYDLILLFGDNLDQRENPPPLYPYPISIGMLADTNPANNDEHQLASFLLDPAAIGLPGVPEPQLYVFTNTGYTAGSRSISLADGGSWLIRPSAVPVPAAIWLFGTGIIGLLGYSRIRKAA